jgi:hypothetical protein
VAAAAVDPIDVEQGRQLVHPPTDSERVSGKADRDVLPIPIVHQPSETTDIKFTFEYEDRFQYHYVNRFEYGHTQPFKKQRTKE